MVVATVLILVSYVVVTSWGLSREQVLQRDFSDREAVVRVNAPIEPGANRSLRTIRESANGAPVVLHSASVRVSDDPDKRVRYQESDWSAAPFGFNVVSGHWPTSAGEVVVSQDLASAADDALSLLSDTVDVRVVGVADDAYSDGAFILAGPGTWESLPPEARTARAGLVASASVLTSQKEARTLVAEFRKQQVSAQTDRATSVTAEESWINASPFAFVVPALLVPMLAVALGVGAGRARQRAFVRRVLEVGGQRSTALGMVSSAFLVVVTLGVLAGYLLGWGLGHLARPVAESWNDRALAPFPGLLGPVAVMAVSALIGLAAGMLQLRPPRTGVGASRRANPAIRRWAALALACAAVVVAAWTSSAAHAMVVGAFTLIAIALVTPEIVSVVARKVERPTPHWRLASRLLRADRAVTTEIVLTMVVLALPLTTAVLLTTSGSSARAETLAPVGPGQILVAGEGGLAAPAPSAVSKTVAGALDTSSGVASSKLFVTDNTWYEVGPGKNASVIAVSTVDDVETVWGAPLSAGQKSTLEQGGALVWEPGADLQINGRMPSPPVKTAAYQPTEEWATQTGAVMLAEPARAQGVKLRSGGTVYAHVTTDAADRAVAAVREGGLDQSLLQRHHAPRQLLAPAVLIASAALLAILMLGITAISSHARTASLRRQFGRIVAVGADGGVVRRVQLITQWVITALAIVGASLVTMLTVAVMLFRLTGTSVNPPWGVLLLLVAALIVAQSSASLVALRQLRPEVLRGT
ncbi:hypothetical protein [Janibacter sp. LM]|uniref:ABC transporter permease n=2 Tax=Janibacter TaxID=53457 RepID=UPI0031F6E668